MIKVPTGSSSADSPFQELARAGVAGWLGSVDLWRRSATIGIRHLERAASRAYRAALDQLKPVFVVTKHPPAESSHYHLVPSSYFGIVDGYWVVPHPVSAGTCDEEW